jgi:hypothetical protein
MCAQLDLEVRCKGPKNNNNNNLNFINFGVKKFKVENILKKKFDA